METRDGNVCEQRYEAEELQEMDIHEDEGVEMKNSMLSHQEFNLLCHFLKYDSLIF